MAPIGTPSNSSGYGSSSTRKSEAPRRQKGNRSPIRYPTPEPDNPSTTSCLGLVSTNPNLHRSQLDSTRGRTIRTNSTEPMAQNAQSDLTTADYIPRRSCSHNGLTSQTVMAEKEEHTTKTSPPITNTTIPSNPKDTTQQKKTWLTLPQQMPTTQTQIFLATILDQYGNEHSGNMMQKVYQTST